MTALLIVILALGVAALLERAHRRAGLLDTAPGRPPMPGVDRVRAELDAAAEQCTVPHPIPRRATHGGGSPASPRIAA